MMNVEHGALSIPEQFIDAVMFRRYLVAAKQASEMTDWDDQIIADALYYTDLYYSPTPSDGQDDREDYWK